MAPSDHAPPPANVLLVDDEPANLLALEAVLGDLGQNLVRAASGEEALRRLLHDDFAVILLDVRMGGLDGFETANLIRGRERSRHTPIIFLTAVPGTDFPAERAYELGAVDYLVKPLVPAILRAKVAGFVQLYQQAERLRRLEREAAERRAAEEALRARAEALAEAHDRKDQFLAMLAHEFRTPLASLLNAVRIMRMRGDERRQAVGWARGVMERQVRHLARLVDDLLDASRIARGKLRLSKESVELASVVADAVETCRPLVEDRRHTLEVALPPEPVRLDADPSRLAQVLTNLLTNAARYTPEGGRIRLAAAQEAGQVVLSVQDNGIGVRADMLPHIFDLFAQGETGQHQPEGGLGIGLALVKSLVEMHGGTVEARSDGPGSGSTFAVRLPVPSEAGRAGSAGRTSTAPKARPPASRRILAVDDNRDVADTLAMMLRMEGHEVRVVNHAAAVLEAARDFRPDVVLLDIGLPGGMNGYELARRLRERPGQGQVLLVALTGYGQDEDKRLAREAGFDAHLTKPADLDDLLALLADAPVVGA
jgi:signal transduction histidine kinase